MSNGGELPKDALTSVAELYPIYLDTVRPFRCPSTKNRPRFLVGIPTDIRLRTPNPDLDGDGTPWDQDDQSAYTAAMAMRDGTGYLFSNRTWSLIDTSYGYDTRVYPSSVSNHAMLADMDGSNTAGAGAATRNHKGGHNVLYVDCTVQWKTSNYATNDLSDNIFTEIGAFPGETGWSADTDSYISDNTDPYNPADATPDFTHLEPVDGGFNGRGGSYYSDLQAPTR